MVVVELHFLSLSADHLQNQNKLNTKSYTLKT